MNKKWIIYIAVGLIVFITFICFASEIQVWMMSKLTSILVLIIAFAAGWLLGRFGGRLKSNGQTTTPNNTEGQR